MISNYKLNIDTMLVVDETGNIKPPTLRQLIDREMLELYRQDKTKDKSEYIANCIVIYYLGDPKSPAKQAGLSDAEALAMAIEQAGLPKNYTPSVLVARLIERYYNENVGEAGRTLNNLQKAMHNVNLSITKINDMLNDKLNAPYSSLDEIDQVLTLVDHVNKKAGEIPALVKKIEEAKQNLLYEQETEISRGGNIVLSSMNADNYN